MDRRSFLAGSASSLGAGALGASGLGEAHRWFASSLANLRSLPTRSDYTLDEGLVYFNHGSVGTMPRLVQEAHAKYLSTCERNPWLYMWGGAWEAAREQTRSRAAEFLGCDAGEIVINRNTTDGFNLLAGGLALERGDEVLFSNFNHAGASVCWEHRAAEKGFSVRHIQIPFGEVAELTEEQIIERHTRAVRDETRVLVLPHMDNTLGLLTPVAAIARAARKLGVEFVFADGAQVVGMLPMDVTALGVDAYCMSPHKWVQSPKGVGLMYVKKALQPRVRPDTVTWGQNRWKGSVRVFEDYGTRDLPAVLALGDALAFQAKAGIEKSAARRHELWELVRARVAADKRLVWRSPNRWELGGSLYGIEVRDKNSNQIGEQLWKKHQIVVRSFRSRSLNTLRLSLNVANTAEEIDRFFKVLTA